MKPLIGIAVVLASISLWWLWPQRVELSDSDYEVAIALYHVCNQSSEEGLAKIESLLAEAQPLESDGQVSPLCPIIEMAKLGDWKDAAKACRRVLDDQVTPNQP